MCMCELMIICVCTSRDCVYVDENVCVCVVRMFLNSGQ